MKKLTKEFNAVSLTAKEVFQIELPAIPSAGYLWSVSIREGEGRLLTEQSRAPQTQAVGGGITQVFTFVADKTGTLVIDAVYQRQWEGKPADSKTFTVNVK